MALTLALSGLGASEIALGQATPAARWASTSGLAVAIDSLHHRQYVFWRGRDARVYEASYGPAWSGPHRTQWFASSTPAAAAGPTGALYLAWQGSHGHIYEASYGAGKWSRARDLTRAEHWGAKGVATAAVALAISPRSGAQLLAWRGLDGRIHMASYTRKWKRPRIMPWPAAGAPSLAATDAGHQYAFWATSTGHLNEAWYTGAWHGPLDLTAAEGWGEFGQSTTRPAVAVDPVHESQYLFWTAVDGRLYEASYAHGWHGPQSTGWSTASPPAAGARSARQYVFWQGADGTIWESWHGAHWSGPRIPLRHAAARGRDVEVTQTSVALRQQLARLAPLRFGAPPPPGLPRIAVDDAVRYQRFAGIGGAMTDSSAWLIHDELSSATRGALMNDLFGATGVHFGFTLVPMGGSDFTRDGRPYTYDDMPAGQSDPELVGFSIAHDEPYILPVLRQMLQINPQTMVMATPWTAPPWMKANGSYDDLRGAGKLLDSAYQPFANYFVKFLQAYSAEGVPVSAISPDNEPDSNAAFPSMAFPESSEAQWIVQNLDPALAQAGLHPRLYGGDTGWAGPSYSSALVSSPANGSLTGVGWHCYGGLPSVMSALHDQAPVDDQILTECAQGIQPYPVPEVLIASLRNWSSVVTLWNLALDPAGGPVQPPNSGCWGCTGEVTVDEATGTVGFRPAYFQLGQVSAFVQPGATRIGSNSFVGYYQNGPGNYGVTPGLDDVAFLNPDGSHVLVAFNNSTRPIRFGVAWAGRGFTYSLASKAMVTFRWAR
jgi:glucosylceramidase